ncbi:MAG: hypothetical protein CMJ19_17170 [Phycisphaeraceae bacterium]|nr:hypothetical protein [Phycisphaeraceae bacterium]
MHRSKWLMMLLQITLALFGMFMMLYSVQLIISNERSHAAIWFFTGLVLLLISGGLQYYEYHMGRQRR